jgi:uncharacterized protein
MKIHALRLQPDQDLRSSLKEFVHANQIQAGFIVTAIGSLKQATLRFANQNHSTILHDKFEIVSLAGTVSIHGMHLHGVISDGQGRVIGGHLDNGCVIYTTAEIVIGESEEFTFLRAIDPQTGCKELIISPR